MPKYREPSRPVLLAAILMRALPGASARFVAQAIEAGILAAKAHKAAAETECSYPVSDAWQKRTETRLANLAGRATELLFAAAKSVNARPFGELPPAAPVRVSRDGQGVVRIGDGGLWLRFKFGGDPRGACGWLYVSNADGDSFGECDGVRGFALYSGK